MSYEGRAANTHFLRGDGTFDQLLNSSGRLIKGIDAADDIIIDTTAKGIVLKDSLGNYWRLGVSTLGVLSITSLGASKP